jgi:hypothetical protein
MRRNRLFSLGIAAGLVAVLLLSYQSEPSYDGKTLSYWFRQWVRQSNSFGPPPEAFRKLGKQAVPYLSAALEKRESRLNRLHIYIHEALPDSLQRPLKRPVRASLIRWKAARALSEIGPEASAALPALIGALQDHESRVRYAAVNAIVAIGPEARKFTPDLIQALEFPDRWFRSALAEAIIKLESYSEEASPKIAEALIDIIRSLESTSPQALASLKRINPVSEKTVLALADAITEHDAYLLKRAKLHTPSVISIRSNAFLTLVKFAERNDLAIQLLGDRLEDPNLVVRALAAEFMGSLHFLDTHWDHELSESPSTALRAPSPPVGEKDGMRGFGFMGSLPRPFPQMKRKLMAMMAETNSLVRINAAVALYRIDPGNAPAIIAPLADGLSESNVEIQRRAAQALEMIGPAAIVPVAGLINNLKPADRTAATNALARFAPALAPQVLSFPFGSPLLK